MKSTSTQPNTIQVSCGSRTTIEVISWPKANDDYVVNSTTRSTDGVAGRGLEVIGWAGFPTRQEEIAWIDLHVGKARKPLLICAHRFKATLHSSDRPFAVAAMVGCAVNIAELLFQEGVGSGYIEWQFDKRAKDDEHFKRFQGFADLHPVVGSYTRPAGVRYLGTKS